MANAIDKSTLTWFGGLLFGAIGTTVAAVHFLYDQYIIPLKLIESSQSIEKLTEKIDSQANIVNELKEAKSELTSAQSRLAQIEYSQLFLSDDIYPSTIKIVRLGKTISDVYDMYDRKYISEGTLSSSQPFVLVKFENSVFGDIRYSYDPKTKKIEGIALSLDYKKKLGDDFLEKSITKALGAPAAAGDQGQFKWKPRGGGNVYVIGTSYLILDKGLAPRMWGGPQ